MDSDFFLLLQVLLCFVLNLLINVLFLLTVIYMKVKKLLFVLYGVFLAYGLCKAESLQGNPADGSTTRSKETITIQKITRSVRYLENNINKLG